MSHLKEFCEYLFWLEHLGQLLLLIQQQQKVNKEQNSHFGFGCSEHACPHFRSLAIHNMWCQWTLWPHTEPMQ